MYRLARVYFENWAGRAGVPATVLSEYPGHYRVRFEATAFCGCLRAGDIGVVPKHSVIFAGPAEGGVLHVDDCSLMKFDDTDERELAGSLSTEPLGDNGPSIDLRGVSRADQSARARSGARLGELA